MVRYDMTPNLGARKKKWWTEKSKKPYRIIYFEFKTESKMTSFLIQTRAQTQVFLPKSLNKPYCPEYILESIFVLFF